MKKLFLAPLAALAAIPAALAHCPLCTVATGAAVAVGRFYGVDDAIMGILVGGFIVSGSLWFHNWIVKKKGKEFMKFQDISLIILGLVLTLISLIPAKLFANTASLFGLPKLMTGMLLGTLTATLGHKINASLQEQNGGKNYVKFQGMLFLLGAIVLTSVALLIGGAI